MPLLPLFSPLITPLLLWLITPFHYWHYLFFIIGFTPLIIDIIDYFDYFIIDIDIDIIDIDYFHYCCRLDDDYSMPHYCCYWLFSPCHYAIIDYWFSTLAAIIDAIIDILWYFIISFRLFHALPMITPLFAISLFSLSPLLLMIFSHYWFSFLSLILTLLAIDYYFRYI
jgi:hypothetical protein